MQSLNINNLGYDKNYLSYGELLKGATLKFEMGNQPNLKRGTNSEDYPYSFTTYSEKK